MLLPFSCFRRFLRLHILTAHTERMMAIMKKSIPPTIPAVTALLISFLGTSILTSSLSLQLPVIVQPYTLILYFLSGSKPRAGRIGSYFRLYNILDTILAFLAFT